MANSYNSNSASASQAFGGSNVAAPSREQSQVNQVAGEIIDTQNQPLKNPYVPRGDAADFDSKYKITDHVYPEDLLGNTEHGNNYVVFYINVSSDSKLVKESSVETVDDYTPNDVSDIRARDVSKGQLTTGLAGQNFVAGTVAFGSGSTVGKVVGASATAYAQTSLIQNDTPEVEDSPKFTRQMKRLRTAITLHIPNTLNINYGVQYEEADTLGLQMGLEAGGIVADTFKALTTGGLTTDTQELANRAKDAANTVVEGVKNLKSAATNVALTTAGTSAQALTGLAPNPKKEQVFRNVDFRTFTFDYQFYPRSSTEAQKVLNIIKEFKLHMHPEFKDDGNWVYIYPSEFDIIYYKGARENLNINRHTSCVLTNMNVNYTPQGQFTTFPDGMPTQINIALTFRELTLLTKDKIQDNL